MIVENPLQTKMKLTLKINDGFLIGNLNSVDQYLPNFQPLMNMKIHLKNEFKKWLDSEKRSFEYEFVDEKLPYRKITINCMETSFKEVFESFIEYADSVNQTTKFVFGNDVFYVSLKSENGFCPCPGLIAELKLIPKINNN